MQAGLRDALRFHEEGRLGEAERLYRETLWTSPRDYDALHMLGILKLQQGRAEEAASLIAAAIEVDATSVAAHCNYGLALAALCRHEDALASFENALALNPRNAATLASLGDTLCDLKRPMEALVSYDKALAIDSRLVPALVNRGIVLRDLGRPADALASYEQALAVDGQDAEAWSNRGVVLNDLGRQDEALVSYDRAVAVRPDYLDALFNRGNTLLLLRRPAEALMSFDRVLALKPDFPDVYNNRGNALSALGRHEPSLASYEKALALAPEHLDARINRAGALGKLHRFDEAIAEYETLRSKRADLPNLLNDLVGCRVAICRWPQLQELAGELVASAVEGRAAADPFMLLGLECTPDQHLACTRMWLRQRKVISSKRQWNPNDFSTDKIRIAYLSADFHRHVTAYVMAELFELHDRSRFEIIGISFGPDDHSPVRSRLIKSFDRFFDVASRTDADVAALIRGLKTHIAVDLKGHTTDSRIGILAERAAPIQASYMGFPGTTGADFIDYVIADRVVLPFAQQRSYTEKIAHLPDCYYVTDTKRAVAPLTPSRREASLPDEGFVFCCFNNSWKLNTRMFDIWTRLLRAVDGSVLWLFEANAAAAANLRREAAARGIDPARIVFARPLDQPAHLARLKLADLLLDTLPYNAHTTATDALWLGVPIVTCMGESFVGRVAASVLQTIGLPELVTTTLADYEALALKLATQPEVLRSIRDKLKQNRQTSALFDTRRFCRHLEAVYATMWRIWQQGDAPRSFAVDPFEG